MIGCLGEEADLSIPFYVMGGLSLFGIYLIFLLPETSKAPLPNTLQDAMKIKDPRYNGQLSTKVMLCGVPKAKYLLLGSIEN